MFWSRQYAHTLAVLAAMALAPFLCGVTEAADWSYTADYDGHLTVQATKDNVPYGAPLFDGPVQKDGTYRGAMPDEANDFQITFEETGGSGLIAQQCKLYLRDIVPDFARLEAIYYWLKERGVLPPIPVLASTGEPGLVTAVDVRVMGGVIIDGYEVADGRCTELPGFIFGTTPLVYDPTVGRDVNPFSTKPFTGRVYTVGKLTVLQSVEAPAASTWGLILVVLLLVATGAIAVVRRRRPCVP